MDDLVINQYISERNAALDKVEFLTKDIERLKETVSNFERELGKHQSMVIKLNGDILYFIEAMNQIMNMSSLVYEPTKNRLYNIYLTAYKAVSGDEK